MLIVKRQRGGQPNNTNAPKHGYYANKLPEAVSHELHDHKFNCLEEEKEIIRREWRLPGKTQAELRF